jgi:hypothetical protein
MGSTDTVVSGIVRAATMSAPIGSAPAVIGRRTVQPSRSVLTRRAEVAAATAIITRMNVAVVTTLAGPR